MQIIRNILNIKLSHQPNTKIVKLRLQILTITHRHNLINSDFGTMACSCHTLKTRIKAKYFKLWGWAISLFSKDNN